MVFAKRVSDSFLVGPIFCRIQFDEYNLSLIVLVGAGSNFAKKASLFKNRRSSQRCAASQLIIYHKKQSSGDLRLFRGNGY